MKGQVGLAVLLRHKTGVTGGQQRVGIGHDDGGGLLAAHLVLQRVQGRQQVVAARVVAGEADQRAVHGATQHPDAALQADLKHLLFGVFEQLGDQKRLQRVQCFAD